MRPRVVGDHEVLHEQRLERFAFGQAFQARIGDGRAAVLERGELWQLADHLERHVAGLHVAPQVDGPQLGHL